jgi:myo-inositol-1(or 4)-monophosphatase
MHPLLSTAVRCARLAGNVILKNMDQLDRINIETKGRRDYVSDVDRLAEQEIIAHVSRAYPAHGFVAEESGSKAADSEFVWYIDPLDGTTNYLHSYPEFAVSIGIARRGVLEHAVVYHPLANELFTATRGQGAQLNNRRIRCTTIATLDHALLGTGFPVKRLDVLDRWMRVFRAALPRCAGVRRSGAAALDLANVAAGRLDGFWEFGLSPWDMAAGALLVREAGGLVADPAGGQEFLDGGDIVVAGPRLFNAMLQLVRSRAA